MPFLSLHATCNCAIQINPDQTISGSGLELIWIGSGLGECVWTRSIQNQSSSMHIICPVWIGLWSSNNIQKFFLDHLCVFSHNYLHVHVPLILFTDDYLHCTCSLHVTSIASLIVHAIVHDKHNNMTLVLQYLSTSMPGGGHLGYHWAQKPEYKALKPWVHSWNYQLRCTALPC